MSEVKKSEERLKVIEKINELEKLRLFDKDVEDDPVTKVLEADQINYLDKSLSKKIKRKFTFYLAKRFINKLKKNNQFILKEIKGLEHFNSLNSGAIITCNHFNALDSFAIQLTYEETKHRKKRKFYRVIREGNYTSFTGFYGKLMRNCDTLPLSSSAETMKKFLKSCDTLLCEGNFILVYPEESMWWNYRKPKPLKPGAFKFAVKSDVPVLPVFITMEDTEFIDNDGFNVQEYTVHISKPIYPDDNLTKNENIVMLSEANYNTWKEIYEKTYGIKLEY